MLLNNQIGISLKQGRPARIFGRLTRILGRLARILALSSALYHIPGEDHAGLPTQHKDHCSNTNDVGLAAMNFKVLPTDWFKEMCARKALQRYPWQYGRGSGVTYVSQLSTAYLDHLYSLSFSTDMRRELLSMLRKRSTHLRINALGSGSHLQHGAQIQRICAEQDHIPGGLARIFTGNRNVC